MEELNAEELIRYYQEGDTTVVEPLVNLFYSKIMGYLYRVSGDYHLAEDLTQETFCRLFKNAGNYKYPNPVKPWLFTIAVNIFRDYWRKQGSRGRLTSLDSEIPDSSPTVEEDCFRREDIREIAGLLTKLNENFREVLILRYVQEMTLKEITEVLNIPEGTVKSRLFRGLDALKQVMEKGGYGDE